MNYNSKDIFLERATTNGTFEEYALRAQPNSVVVSDANGNLSMVDTSSFMAGTGSITIAISASIADSASFAMTSSAILLFDAGLDSYVNVTSYNGVLTASAV
jgi:hypothetical protein